MSPEAGGGETHRMPASDGLQLQVRTCGEPGSPAVLALHGWPGDSSDWSRIAPLIPDVYWIAPDLRGFGGSDAPPPSRPSLAGPDAHVRDLRAVLDRLEVTTAVVAAHDIGATIAAALAVQQPDKVAALALFNPPYPGIAERRFTPQAQQQLWYQHLHQLPLADALLDGRPDAIEAYLRHFYENWSAAGSPLDVDELAALTAAYSRPGRFSASIAYYRARAQSKLLAAVATSRPTPPTFVAWGEEDPVMSVDWADRLDQHFNLRRFERVPEVGHFLPLEAPAVAARTIRTALAAVVNGATA